MTMLPDSPTMTAAQLARVLGLSENSLYRACERGHLPCGADPCGWASDVAHRRCGPCLGPGGDAGTPGYGGDGGTPRRHGGCAAGDEPPDDRPVGGVAATSDGGGVMISAGLTRLGKAGMAGRGAAGHSKARHGPAWQGRHGGARRGAAGQGGAWQVWHGMAGPGAARPGLARRAGRGLGVTR